MKLVYFASIREQLGCDQEQLARPPAVTSVAQLIDWLCAQRGAAWEQALRHPQLLCAVNQEMCDLSTAVGDEDEVAFFPPVTGG